MTNPCRSICNCQNDPRGERLEYDYTYDEAAHGGKPQPLPRIRERGEYYIDSWNGQPWECNFGTNEDVSLYKMKLSALTTSYTLMLIPLSFRMEHG